LINNIIYPLFTSEKEDKERKVIENKIKKGVPPKFIS
jgi:hypothetical protein